MKITVFGIGYVGLSLSTMISSKYPVVAIDIAEKKVMMVNDGKSPIIDKGIIERINTNTLQLKASTDPSQCIDSDFVIIATPTNFDEKINKFDTSSVEEVIKEVETFSPNSTIVIKSTVPIGFTKKLYDQGLKNILFSPEFLREGYALYDNLYPSRIIVGVPHDDNLLVKKSKLFMNMLCSCAEKKEIKCIIMESSEAESVKLFSNSFLAMRIAFFNELDSFAELNNLNTKNLIDGICSDSRIGNYYNNPSFGYGGYCLPKDTKQLLANYGDAPNEIIGATVRSNDSRKAFISKEIDKIIISLNGKIIGIYKLTMKSGSDNFRESSVIDIIEHLKTQGVEIIIYEPIIKEEYYCGCKIVNSLDDFKNKSDVVVANRMNPELVDISQKVFTRDIYCRD